MLFDGRAEEILRAGSHWNREREMDFKVTALRILLLLLLIRLCEKLKMLVHAYTTTLSKYFYIGKGLWLSILKPRGAKRK